MSKNAVKLKLDAVKIIRGMGEDMKMSVPGGASGVRGGF
jgi:hypothetical protein